MRELGPGDVVTFEADERHWHRATPHRPMVHLALQDADGATAEWGRACDRRAVRPTVSHAPEATLRSQVELITDLLAENETGLLITLDEIHQNQIAELRHSPQRYSTLSERNDNSRSSAPASPQRSPM